ncbi:MAG: BlaI/MecI/CopY family transcriptional regulator [Pseudomonadota bacterium]
MQISDAELEVMKVLWARPGISATDVHDHLGKHMNGHKDWSVRTVKTLLSRLVEKGALSTEEDGRRYLYTPTIEQEDYKSGAVRQFVDRVFSGRAAPLIAHLADAKDLTEADIEELEKLLGELKK